MIYGIVNNVDGVEIGRTDTPVWIRKSENGCFTPCEQWRAEGIAYKSVPYSLAGRDMEGAEGTVSVMSDHLGDILQQQGGTQTDIQLAVAELAEIMEEQNTANQLAIAEAVEAMMGGEE